MGHYINTTHLERNITDSPADTTLAIDQLDEQLYQLAQTSAPAVHDHDERYFTETEINAQYPTWDAHTHSHEAVSDFDTATRSLIAIAALGGQVQTVKITALAGDLIPAKTVVYVDSYGKVRRYLDGGVHNVRLLGMVMTAVNINEPATVYLQGELTGFSGLTPFRVYYATATNGAIELRPATTFGEFKGFLAVGFSKNANTLVLTPSRVKVGSYVAALPSYGYRQLYHHPDPAPRVQSVHAIGGASVLVPVIENPTSNHAGSVRLHYADVATYTADQCTGGTPTVSSRYSSSYPATNAFDNSATTYWITLSGTVTGWLAYAFTAAKTIRQYSITGHASLLNSAPKNWTLEYKDAGGNWQIADTRTDETGWTASQRRVYTVAGAYSSTEWRINVTANNGYASYLAIAEMEMMEAVTYGTPNNVNLAQTFQLNNAETITALRMMMRKTGSPGGTLSISVQALSNGAPSGTSLLTITGITEASMPTTLSLVEFSLGAGVTLQPGTYALVFSVTSRTADDVNLTEFGTSAGSIYASGNAMNYNGTAWANLSTDLIFTICKSYTYSEPLTIGRVSTRNGDLGVRFTDGNGLPYDIVTYFENTADVSRETTVYLEL